jgi:dolichol-phosphate mannosyltransferase
MEAKISIILPTYNERENVKKVIEEIICNVNSLQEIIVVDDNSPDGTWSIIEKMAVSDKKIKLIRRVNERGLTSAIWAGIIQANGAYIAWMDCDMSMHPSVLPSLIQGLNSYDIVIGSRYVKGGEDRRPLFRRFVSRGLNVFAQVVLSISIKDLTSGFVAVRKEVFKNIKLEGNYGEYCIRFLYEAFKRGYKIKELPYVFTDRTDGKSKSEESFFSFGIGYIKTIFKLRKLIYD